MARVTKLHMQDREQRRTAVKEDANPSRLIGLCRHVDRIYKRKLAGLCGAGRYLRALQPHG